MPKLLIPRKVLRASATMAAFCMLFACPAMADELKIGGTGNALGTIRLLGEAFAKKHPDTNVTVLSSIGSSGAIKAVPQGAVDIGLASRLLTDEERSTGVVAAEYARTLTVLAVSTKSKVTSVTLNQLADIFSGNLAKWPDGTVIRVVLRQPGDDNTKQLRGLSPALEKATTAAEQRPGLPFAVIDQEAADKIESIPGAIGITTLSLIKSEGRSLRPLNLDGIEPTTKNGASGTYPIVKRFFFVTRSAPSAAVQKFVAFVNSPEGREVLLRTGHWIP